MKTRMLIMRLLATVCLLAAGCSTTDRPAADLPNGDTVVMEVPVIPDAAASQAAPATVQPQAAEDAGGEVQERGVIRIAPGLAFQEMATATFTKSYPGQFAFRTKKGYYLTAVNGGGRSSQPTIITSSGIAGAWEKFKIEVPNPSTSHDKAFRTANGNYVTAVGGGGLRINAFHTDATQAKDWERFRLTDLEGVAPSAPAYYGLQTIKGKYLTAFGGGGQYHNALMSDAEKITDWRTGDGEKFRIVKCGDPGSGYQYGIWAANDAFLTASKGGGSSNYVVLSGPSGIDPKFKLFRQSDGTYAFQTGNGVNYLTALGGGGQVQTYKKCGSSLGACLEGFSKIFHTDATQVQAWEKFRVIDQGDCTYTIQTSSGFFMGIYKDPSGRMSLTTRRDGAPTLWEKFQLVVYGLASPAG